MNHIGDASCCLIPSMSLRLSRQTANPNRTGTGEHSALGIARNVYTPFTLVYIATWQVVYITSQKWCSKGRPYLRIWYAPRTAQNEITAFIPRLCVLLYLARWHSPLDPPRHNHGFRAVIAPRYEDDGRWTLWIKRGALLLENSSSSVKLNAIGSMYSTSPGNFPKPKTTLSAPDVCRIRTAFLWFSLCSCCCSCKLFMSPIPFKFSDLWSVALYKYKKQAKNRSFRANFFAC